MKAKCSLSSLAATAALAGMALLAPKPAAAQIRATFTSIRTSTWSLISRMTKFAL